MFLFFGNTKKKILFTTLCPALVADYKHKFRCIVCDKNVTYAAGGEDNVRHHSERKIQSRTKATKDTNFWLSCLDAETTRYILVRPVLYRKSYDQKECLVALNVCSIKRKKSTKLMCCVPY